MVVRRSATFTLEVDLSIEPGSTVVLLGPNGAGKSSAVSAISGLLPIDEGKIELDGTVLDDPAADVFVPPEQRRVGVVFQDYLLFPHLSVLENVAFGLRSRKVAKDEAVEAASSWLDRLGLSSLESVRPGDLSGGQAQRVALARALVTEPDLLLLDEPLAALDVTTRVESRRVLADYLAGFEGPRLLITHDPTEAFLLADEIEVLEDGTVTQSGLADDIRLRPRTTYAAALAGANLIAGEAAEGTVQTATQTLQIADHDLAGPVLLTIDPTAISVHRVRPEGSPRNSWATTIERLEPLGDRARLLTGEPLALTVEVTRDAIGAMSLHAGEEVWVAVKATEIGVEANG
jgi:molybdate transport system ATP-binding protein